MGGGGVGLTPRQQMVSSGAGALAVSVLMTPLDVVKVRLQSQERGVAGRSLPSSGGPEHLARAAGARHLHTAMEAKPRCFTSTADAFVKIARAEGLPSLWSGLSPTLVLTVPATVTYFTMFGQLRAAIEEARGGGGGGTPAWVPLVAGGLARVTAVTLVSPLELVRTRMQAGRLPLAQVRRCLAGVVAARGPRGLWSGYTATLLRDVPFSAIYWPLYERTKLLLHSLDPAHSPNSFATNFLSGAAAGSVASTATLPFDVIKTLKQVVQGERGGRVRPVGNLSLARELVAKQGTRSLFAGLTPRLLKVAPACGILISSYEWCKAIFLLHNQLHNS